jgi:hypothetical protein
MPCSSQARTQRQEKESWMKIYQLVWLKPIDDGSIIFGARDQVWTLEVKEELFSSRVKADAREREILLAYKTLGLPWDTRTQIREMEIE